MGLNLLKLENFTKISDINNSVIVHVPSKNKTALRADLFVSLHCVHCYNVLFNLTKSNLKKIDWNIHFLAVSHKDMLRIANMLRDKELEKNPFKVIIKYKDKEKLSEIRISKDIKMKLESARRFFRFRGFKGVPLLVVKGKSFEFTIVGDRSIGEFLLREGVIKKWYMVY